MLLGGLWHGASWTFVVWGGLHGFYLSAERVLRSRFAGYKPAPLEWLALGLLTYVLVNITWVFFRATTFKKAWEVLNGMLGLNVATVPILSTFYLASVLGLIGCVVATHWYMRDRTLESVVARTRPALISAAWAGMLFLIVISQGTGNAFIYFQF
jgi:alginate O-acetyltransferase complex protein AlgI